MLSVIIYHKDHTLSHIDADEASDDLLAFRNGKQIINLDPDDVDEVIVESLDPRLTGGR